MTSRDVSAYSTVLGSTAHRFVTADDVDVVVATRDYEIITGFGPTNAPTAGTLSVMIGIIELQRALSARMTVVISDLGAWNCRRIAWNDLCYYRDRMARFLLDLGFDDSGGTLRTHQDRDNLIRAGRIARYLGIDDVQANQEEFIDLYGAHGLLGSNVGLLVDTLYTVADVLEPVERGRKATLMVSGMEEAYFTKLARIVLERQAVREPGLAWTGLIGALYFRVVRGLGGFPKMSKSLPDSAVHLGLSELEIAARIRSARAEDQPALMDAIDLASGWPEEKRRAARRAFESLPDEAAMWADVKEGYLDTFRGFAGQWKQTADA